jgi:hypothetical protein
MYEELTVEETSRAFLDALVEALDTAFPIYHPCRAEAGAFVGAFCAGGELA